ncbi:MAG: FtsH protease activity modulator HflK [Phycisphaerales bacterium]|nr:MAG: FtsH protease activity modulator HflK [Phycisphaerales bacterium]
MEMRDILERMGGSQGRGYASLGIKWVTVAVVVVVVGIGLITSIYTVPTDSAGVVKYFGRYSRTTEPGIHLKIPYWIETAVAVPVKKVQKEEFGYRTLEAGVDSRYLGIEELNTGRSRQDDLVKLIRDSGERASRGGARQLGEQAKEILRGEYIMLTGDLNITDVEWIVQYKIEDARSYLFNVREPGQTIRDASQAVMRQLVGNGSVDEAITIGRIEYESSAEEMIQKLLDEYETGIHVVTVKLQSSNPPQRVRPAFNEVNKAGQQKEQRINEAMKAYNEAIPKTRGEAKKLIESSKGYAAERVNRAEGDVAKFEKIYAEYRKAPEITKRRMYLETMAKLLPLIPEKWIIEQGGAEGGILMKLDLESGSQK